MKEIKSTMVTMSKNMVTMYDNMTSMSNTILGILKDLTTQVAATTGAAAATGAPSNTPGAAAAKFGISIAKTIQASGATFYNLNQKPGIDLYKSGTAPYQKNITKSLEDWVHLKLFIKDRFPIIPMDLCIPQKEADFEGLSK